jgi:uncharacterized protein (DUF697 family)
MPRTKKSKIAVAYNKAAESITDSAVAQKEVTLTNKEVVPMSTTEDVLETNSAVLEAPLPDQVAIDAIIRNRVYASMAVGLMPVPLVDLAALTAVQTELLYRLSKAYNVPFTAEWGKKAVTLALGSAVPGLLTPTIGDLLRYVPVIGQGLSVTSWPLTLGASTYALGHAFAKHFASGGNFLNCDFSKISEEVKSGYSKGTEAVKGLLKKGNKEQEAEAEPAVDTAVAA